MSAPALKIAKPDLADEAIAELSSREATITQLRERYAGASPDTKEGYELVRVGIGELRTLRGDIEKRRVELKADALAWGRRVDSEAKRLTQAILAVEEPLKAAKQLIDDEKERLKRAKREEEEARLRAEREAEEQRLRLENERLQAERKALDEQRAREEAAKRLEFEKLAAERRALDEQRQALAREEQERARKLQAEQAETERQRRAAERQRMADAKGLTPEMEQALADFDGVPHGLLDDDQFKDEERVLLQRLAAIGYVKPCWRITKDGESWLGQRT